MKKFFISILIFSFVSLFIIKNSIYAATPIGNYLVLNGGYVKTTNSDSSIPSLFSFKASINPTSVNGRQIILSIGDKASSKRYYEIGINGGLLTVDYDYNGSHSSVNAGNLVAGSWQDIEVDISSTQTKLFIGGTQVFAPFMNNNLGPIGSNIVLGDSYNESFFDSKPYKGLVDEVSISNGSALLIWHMDEVRGEVVAVDSSGNNLNGILIGGDSLIHFFGVLPSPTPTPTIFFGLRPIQWTRPVLPTLSFPNPSNPSPTGSVNPPPSNPSPTTYDRLSISNRTQIPRPSLSQSIFPNSGGTVNTCPPIPGHFCAD